MEYIVLGKDLQMENLDHAESRHYLNRLSYLAQDMLWCMQKDKNNQNLIKS